MTCIKYKTAPRECMLREAKAKKHGTPLDCLCCEHAPSVRRRREVKTNGGSMNNQPEPVVAHTLEPTICRACGNEIRPDVGKDAVVRGVHRNCYSRWYNTKKSHRPSFEKWLDAQEAERAKDIEPVVEARQPAPEEVETGAKPAIMVVNLETGQDVEFQTVEYPCAVTDEPPTEVATNADDDTYVAIEAEIREPEVGGVTSGYAERILEDPTPSEVEVKDLSAIHINGMSFPLVRRIGPKSGELPTISVTRHGFSVHAPTMRRYNLRRFRGALVGLREDGDGFDLAFQFLPENNHPDSRSFYHEKPHTAVVYCKLVAEKILPHADRMDLKNIELRATDDPRIFTARVE